MVFVKKEPTSDDEVYVLEDDIKIEETSLLDLETMYPSSVIIEQTFSICSTCKSAFERKTAPKFLSEADISKCNRCILHTKLNEAFTQMWNNKRIKKNPNLSRSKKKSGTGKMVLSTGAPSESISINKLMFVCATCKNKFERKDSSMLKEASDRYRCNKCILHSRISKAVKLHRRIIK